MYNQFSANELFENLETGKITDEQFYDKLIEASNLPIDKSDIRNAWNAMLLEFREESLVKLEELADRYNIYLLSNTNHIHWLAFDQLFKERAGKDSLDDYFKKAWYSHKIGYRKPNADIYEYVLKDAGILAEDTLFIDDSINNIEAAQQLGIHTHHLIAGERIENLGL